VGMFMVITGAMFFQTLMARSKESAVPFWIMAQKLAAAALVFRAWLLGLFASISLGVAAFDALTAFLVFLFWRRLKS
ncbi:MAG: hypothetical protein N2444_04030, partial [Methylocystis sp.]|nr:hypothetical protein [Methylocystis sp.]